jgi:hypothetical protein
MKKVIRIYDINDHYSLINDANKLTKQSKQNCYNSTYVQKNTIRLLEYISYVCTLSLQLRLVL